MMQTERRVVITGLGLISPLGIGLEPFWSALIEGRGAVAAIESFPVDGLPTNVGAEV
jgi:3-oxoacyl-[acyl-carrier-protein] synthase II